MFHLLKLMFVPAFIHFQSSTDFVRRGVPRSCLSFIKQIAVKYNANSLTLNTENRLEQHV